MNETDVKKDTADVDEVQSGDAPAPEDEATPGEVSEADEASAPAADADEDEAVDETDYRDRWLRAEAELQNYRRRAMRDREEAQRFTEERYSMEIISQLDDLERALESAGEDSPHPWVEGVRLVAKRMTEFLAQQGITAIDALGRPFDPQFHEALLEMDATGSAKPGDVVQVIRKGYQRRGRALRATRVAVAKAPAAESGEADE